MHLHNLLDSWRAGKRLFEKTVKIATEDQKHIFVRSSWPGKCLYILKFCPELKKKKKGFPFDLKSQSPS